MTDTDGRIVYGARCAWWDTIDKASRTSPGSSGHSLPCCPHCGGVLFEVGPEKWWAMVETYEAEQQPGYVEFLKWLQGRCYPTYGDAWEAFEKR